ncbi:MAG TPA: hypothetical protein VEU76_06455 [Candidatus Udaeobacter sp.]|nr:hypothetical protein [Candidatus Udaeobacter sp.]
MERRSVRILVWIALAVPLVMDAVYLSFIRSQGSYGPDIFTVPFVAAFMFLMTGMLAVSLFTEHPVLRTLLRGGAAAGLLVLGVLGAFSIGLPILVAGVLAAVAFGVSIDRSRWLLSLGASAVAAFLCGGVFLVGIDAANRIIVCPPGVTEGGRGNGILLGPYQYQCSGGQLQWSSSPTP